MFDFRVLGSSDLRGPKEEEIGAVLAQPKRLAALAQVQGKLGEAERFYRDAIASDEERGGRPFWYFTKVSLLTTLLIQGWGDTTGAVALVQTALDRAPLDSWAPAPAGYLERAQFYARAGRPELAREVLAEMESVWADSILNQSRVERRGTEGEIAVAEGRAREAIPDLRLARDRSAGQATGYLALLGTAFHQAGEPDSALAQYERFLDTPHYGRLLNFDVYWLPLVYERMAALYEERGEVEKAMEYYSKFVDLWKECDPELRPRVDAARSERSAVDEAAATDRRKAKCGSRG
jgi:tetratricopeptide (TPR) repeat protein